MTKSNNPNLFRQLLKEKDNEINRLKEEINRITNENNELRNLIAFDLKKFEFNNKVREEAILKFIKNNPGITKINVVDTLKNGNNSSNKGYGAPKTLKKIISWLIKENIIRVEKVHKQKHSLYLNDNNILLKIKMDLIQFKEKFYHLMSLIAETKNNDNTIDFKNYILPNIMIDVYYQIIISYIVQILLKWSNEFKKDDTTINKINFIVFFAFFEINLEFRKKFNFIDILRKKAISVNGISSPLLREIIENSFILKPKLLIKYIQHYKRLNLHKEFLSLIDLVWEISEPLFRYLYVYDHQNIFPVGGKELIIKHFSFLVLFCLNENSKYLYDTAIKKEKATLFDFSFTSDQEKKEIKEIIIDYIKNNSDLTDEYKKLREGYKLLD
ncbi:MAG: hypothetical protein ACRD6U_05950 [Nitrososphaeraceae archaeon]